jgi:hypothetical protein
MHRGGALGVEPFAVHGKERPGAIVLKATAGPDTRFADFNGIERLNGVELDVGKRRRIFWRSHAEILAEKEL